MDARLSIIVYRGDPVDLPRTRHTALFVIFADNSTVLIHATGAAGFFSVEQRPQAQPRKSQNFEQDIPVATIRGKTRAEVQSTIAATPTNNSTHDWDCQKWVGDALTGLSNLGWITGEAESDGISKMVDVLWEAKDEE